MAPRNLVAGHLVAGDLASFPGSPLTPPFLFCVGATGEPRNEASGDHKCNYFSSNLNGNDI